MILCTHVQLACVFYIIYRSSVVFFCVSHYARTKPRTISVCTYNLLVCFIIVATALRHSYWNFYSVFKCVFFSYARTTCLCVYIYLPLKCSDFFVYTHVQLACVFYIYLLLNASVVLFLMFFGMALRHSYWDFYLVLKCLFCSWYAPLVFFFEYEIIHYVLK